MGERQTTARVLAACLGGREPLTEALAAVQDPDRLLAAVSTHRLAPLVYDRVRALDRVPPALRERLAIDDIQNRAAHVALLEGLTEVADILDGARLPWLAVKGPVLAHCVYAKAGLRRAGDLDLLIGGSDLRAAIVLLREIGALEIDRNWRFIRRSMAGEVHLMLANRVVVDLHWHLLFTEEERRVFQLPTADLLARRRLVAVGDRPIPTLDPEDTVIHLAYHAAKEGADRAGWLLDIERALIAWPVDWDEVVARARRWQIGLPVATALQRAARAVGAPVPPGVVRALAPVPWAAGCRLVDRALPVLESARGRDRRPIARTLDAVPAIVARSAASSNTAGKASGRVLAEVGRAVFRAIRSVIPGVASPSGKADEDHLSFDAGGTDEREAFLRQVEARSDDG